MRLSFVIPAHNEEKYIGKCLDSVLRACQNCDCETEIVVVNNASTDATHKVASSYENVKVVFEEKKGLARARNSGYLASTGDIIANVDADCIVPEGWLEKVFTEFRDNENLAALSGPHIYYDASRLIRMQTRLFYYLGYITYIINHFLLKRGGMLQGGNFILRRSALEKIGGFDPSIEFYGEDTDVARRAQKAGRVKFTFKLPMLASGRRLKEQGVVKTGARYALNYFWIIFFKKPFSKRSVNVKN